MQAAKPEMMSKVHAKGVKVEADRSSRRVLKAEADFANDMYVVELQP
jgi:hypothetical protein